MDIKVYVMTKCLAMSLFSIVFASLSAPVQADDMPFIAVAKDKKCFVLEPSGKPFTPWGFNYDHDDGGRLIEDYWEAEWPTVEAHFGQMKKLGANVVRIHLQLGKFMDGPDKPNAESPGPARQIAAAWPRRNASTST